MSKKCFGNIKTIMTSEIIRVRIVIMLKILLSPLKNTLPKISVVKVTKNILEKKVTILSADEK